MNFNQYQEYAEQFDLFAQEKYKASDPAFMAKVLGLVGEAGETAEKFKKILRDKAGEISEEDKLEILKELGDVLWYVAELAAGLGITLEDVAWGNVEKLRKRYPDGFKSERRINREDESHVV